MRKRLDRDFSFFLHTIHVDSEAKVFSAVGQVEGVDRKRRGREEAGDMMRE